MKRDLQYLNDIFQSAKIIVSYVAEVSPEMFFTRTQLQDAILLRLVVIGEAANRVSDQTRAELSDIDWHGIRGVRNRLIHEYDDINLDIIWQIASEEIPQLITAIRPYIPPDV